MLGGVLSLIAGTCAANPATAPVELAGSLAYVARWVGVLVDLSVDHVSHVHHLWHYFSAFAKIGCRAPALGTAMAENGPDGARRGRSVSLRAADTQRAVRKRRDSETRVRGKKGRYPCKAMMSPENLRTVLWPFDIMDCPRRKSRIHGISVENVKVRLSHCTPRFASKIPLLRFYEQSSISIDKLIGNPSRPPFTKRDVSLPWK